MAVEIKGLKEFQNKLKDMERKAKKLDGTNHVKLSDLFNSGFMGKYTQFSTFDAFLKSGGFEVYTQEDFEKISDDLFDAHVRTYSKFISWKEMLETASQEWIIKEIGI